ncbi:putative reverse transcriptase domain-containing protein [Tanacetum coccineum]
MLKFAKGAEDDKVEVLICATSEGHALTWWNGNVQTLGLANANQIPWRMILKLTTICHGTGLMCPELVLLEKKKIERYVRGFPERIKGNITSSKPANLHEAINMARELVEQSVQGKLQGAGNDFLQNVTCFGCGEKGHFKDKCPKAGNQQNDGARGRAYVVIENP